MSVCSIQSSYYTLSNQNYHCVYFASNLFEEECVVSKKRTIGAKGQNERIAQIVLGGGEE